MQYGVLSYCRTWARLFPAGKSVAVLEARLVGSGNSGRYIGDLTAWKRHQYSVLLSQYDKATVTSIAESHTAAIKAVKKVTTEFIASDMSRTGPISLAYYGHSRLLVHLENPKGNDRELKSLEGVKWLCVSHGNKPIARRIMTIPFVGNKQAIKQDLCDVDCGGWEDWLFNSADRWVCLRIWRAGCRDQNSERAQCIKRSWPQKC